MPMMPLYQQRTEATGTLGGGASAPTQTAQAEARLAGVLQDFGQQKAKEVRIQEEKDARAWTGEAVSRATLDWHEQLLKRQESADAGAPNFAPTFIEDFNKYAGETIDNAPTPLAKQFLRSHLTSLGTSLGNQALSFESNARVQNRVNLADQAIDNWGKVVQQDPSQYQSALNAWRETAPYTGTHDAKAMDAAKARLSNAAAATVLDRDPYAVREATGKAMGEKGFTGNTGVPWVDDATPEQVKAWNNAALTKIHAIESAKARDSEAAFKIAESMVSEADDLSLKGQYFSDDYKARLLQAVKGFPEFEQRAGSLITGQASIAGFASAPASDREAVLNEIRKAGADPTKGTNPGEAKRLEHIAGINGEIRKAVDANPWQAAQKYGVAKDARVYQVQSAEAAVQLIQLRSATQTQVETWAGKPINPLQPEETSQVADLLAKMPPPARSAALAQIGASMPLGRLTAFADDLDKKDKPLALSLKLGADHTTAGRYVSELVLRGDQALKDKVVKRDDTALSGWRASIAGMVRGTLGDEKAEQDVIDAAYYVRASMDADGTAVPGFKLEASERQAVKMVIGEPFERGGVKTFLPHDMDETAFDTKLKAYTPEKLKVIAPGGLFVRGQPIPFERVAGGITDFGMKKDGRGNYLPVSGGAFITTADGKPLRLPVAP